jgi:hypothetical protein
MERGTTVVGIVVDIVVGMGRVVVTVAAPE